MSDQIQNPDLDPRHEVLVQNLVLVLKDPAIRNPDPGLEIDQVKASPEMDIVHALETERVVLGVEVDHGIM